MSHKHSWRLSEVVVLLVLAVALGVLWWGWTLFTTLTAPLNSIGLGYLFNGVWLTGGILIPYLIRRPGAAFIGETAAAVIEAFITQWGITAVIWGAVQGLGCEIVFAATGYRRYNLWTLILAGVVSDLFSYALDFFYSHYAGLAGWVIAVQIASAIVSGILLAGVLSYFVGRGIIRTGALRGLIPGTQSEGG